MHPPPPPALSPVQEQIAIALASGASIAAAARDASITRQTIHNWLHHNPAFAQLVQQERALRIREIRARVSRLSDRALSALDRILADPAMPPSVQLRAALAVLNRSVKMENAWVLPMPVDSPQFQLGFELVAEMKEEANRKSLPTAIDAAGLTTTQEAASPLPAADLTQFDTFPQNSAFEAAAFEARTSEGKVQPQEPRVPRGAPCPCGSGEKFKRCCGRGAPPILSRAAA